MTDDAFRRSDDFEIVLDGFEARFGAPTSGVSIPGPR
jgi:hypothetical protein